MSTVLVTGGAGYIGSHAVKELLRRGHFPVVYDNLQTGHAEAVSGAPLVVGDLGDPEKLNDIFRSCPIESVLHFAADCLVGESVDNPLKYFNNNVKNSLQLIETMIEYDVKKIVFSSSAAVYGEPEEVPILEDHPCCPTNPYGETKWIFERTLQAFQTSGKIEFIALRYFNAAGADPEGELGEDHGVETHLIPLILQAALSGKTVSIFGSDYDTFDGTCVRDYIHVSDLAEAHFLALQRLADSGGSGIYNLGNGNGYSVREVVAAAEKVTGRRIQFVTAPRRAGDPARLVAGADRIRRELGWVPQYPGLETIIQTAWNWHRNHPNGYKTQRA